MSEDEYDTEVAPKLKEIAEFCGGKGSTFLAYCEFGDGEVGRTQIAPDGLSASAHLAYLAMQARGNVDALIREIVRLHMSGKRDASHSAFLAQFINPISGVVE